ncbi:prepilin peptidase [Aestuariimicrobium kwangyangense]|uniref:prepilin peptidase n=1 Tax=Aestuariimicrobium kwangyangense TaxID=396389 RepID=UPI0003B44397|nr:A24 family peptidase [Aestuariimicrobium kwangyangense]
MNGAWTAAAGALSCSGIALAAWWAVSRLPEPDEVDELPHLPQSPAWTKPSYASVARRRGWVVSTLLVAALLGAWASTLAEPWPWLAWGSAGLVLVTVDLATTYLPVRLHWWAAGMTVVGVAAVLIRDPAPGRVLTVVAGAALATAFFWLVWRITGAFGFGDVRLAVPLGALAGLLGWSGWFGALLAGTALGAVHGLLVSLWRRRHPSGLGSAFPYGPALWVGPWVALALT